MRSPRAWSYVTYLASTVLLGACPPGTATTTDTGPTSDAETETPGTTGECAVGDLGCPCTQGGGCNPGLVCSPDERCVGDDVTTTEGPTSLTTTTSTTAEPSTTTEDTSTTAPPVPCDPADGNPNTDCMAINADQPYCSDSHVCGGCTVLPADGCALIDPSKPICNPEDGRCVECTLDDGSLCGGATPACNPANNTCEGCFEHSHCPETACDIVKRECFPNDQIVYIRHGSSDIKEHECTDLVGQGGYLGAPYCNADLAIAHAQAMGGSGWTFKFLVSKDMLSIHGSISAVFNETPVEPISYAFVHEGEYSQEEASQHLHSRLQSTDAVITIGANVTAYFDNFGIYSIANQGDAGVGVVCQADAKVFLDDSFIRDTRGSGIRSFGCDVHLRRSSIYKSKTEGVELNCGEQHCELHMVNSYISNNQHYQGNGGGGIVAENATLDINFSTILGNNAEVDLLDPEANGDSIHCIGENVGGTIRNSVIGRKQMGNLRSIKCTPELTVKNSLIDSDEFKNDNHKLAGETILAYFLDNSITGARPINPDPGDTEEEKEVLDPTDLDLAKWEKGDPQVDFDGDARPAKDMQVEAVGADVLVGP